MIEKLSYDEMADAARYWREKGLTNRHANALAFVGYPNIEALQKASDLDLRVIPNVGANGLAAIYNLLGRPRPKRVRSSEEVRASMEVVWRARVGDDRFEQLLDVIAETAGDALDTSNHRAAQALWETARRRRKARKVEYT